MLAARAALAAKFGSSGVRDARFSPRRAARARAYHAPLRGGARRRHPRARHPGPPPAGSRRRSPVARCRGRGACARDVGASAMGEASRAAYPYRVCEARCFAAARVGPSAEEIWTHRAGARRCALTRRGARGGALTETVPLSSLYLVDLRVGTRPAQSLSSLSTRDRAAPALSSPQWSWSSSRKARIELTATDMERTHL